MLEIGSLVDGKYKILNKIGQGGMSVVYLAMNERANKQWAIKEVRKDGVSNFEVVKQGLVAEIEMLKRLNHPHLPSIIDVIDMEGSFLIVMDYIEGVSLDKKLKESGPLPQQDVIEWGKQLADVLGYLHSREKPIIYRDMKPANVMLKPDGNVMLIDFGTAREFKSTSVADTVVLGTRGYAAPEQYGGRGQTDARTDIYCLGATLYHLVTGHDPSQPPYEMYPITQWDPNLSPGLEAIILKCIQNNPEDRYQTCAELMYDLEHVDQVDPEVIRIRNRKWRSFIAIFVASILCFGASAAFKVKNDRDNEWKYSQYINQATDYNDFDDLRQAAELFPKRYAPYQKAISIIENDGDFSKEERSKLKETLLDPSFANKTRFANEKEYYKFAYDLASLYLFRSDQNGISFLGLSESQKWFEIASKGTPYESSDDFELTQKDIDNAKLLGDLTKAVAYMHSVSGAAVTAVGEEDAVTGEVKYSYSQYFKDLVSILDLDFFEGSNKVTRYQVYSWIYDLLLKRSSDILRNNEGVSLSDLETVRKRAISDMTDVLSSISKDNATGTYEKFETLISGYRNLEDLFANLDGEGAK